MAALLAHPFFHGVNFEQSPETILAFLNVEKIMSEHEQVEQYEEVPETNLIKAMLKSDLLDLRSSIKSEVDMQVVNRLTNREAPVLEGCLLKKNRFYMK
jgi:hypothetical protein